MKLFKKVLLLVVLLMCSLVMFGCTENDEDVPVVGVLQLVTHGALDNARVGFVEGLKSAGYIDGQNIKLVVKNPEGDTPTLNQMATDLVRSCDLVLAIATPAATALQSAAKAQGKDIPILFTAVTDAEDAQLVVSNANPGGNITGTSDMNPVADQIDLIKELVGGIKKFGLIYNTDEANSRVQANMAKEEASKVGLEVREITVTDANAIATTVKQLINDGSEALYIPTDNLMASNMPAIVSVCEENKIPIICGEESMVAAGGTITYGINYTKLGKQTAAMAVKILTGTKPADIAVETQGAEDLAISVNYENLEKIGLTLPDSIKDRVEK